VLPAYQILALSTLYTHHMQTLTDTARVDQHFYSVWVHASSTPLDDVQEEHSLVSRTKFTN